MSESTDLKEAVDSLKSSIDSLRHELVRKDVYAVDQRLMSERIVRVDKDVTDLELTTAANDRRIEVKVDGDIADRKADRRLMLTIGLGFVASILVDIYSRVPGAGK